MQRIVITGIALFLAVAPGAGAQAVQQAADSVLVLNRTGHWSEAERIGTQMLQRTAASEETVARCQLIEGVAYAQVRQKAHAHAAATLTLFEDTCAEEPSLRGFAREAAQLRREIAVALAPKG